MDERKNTTILWVLTTILIVATGLIILNTQVPEQIAGKISPSNEPSREFDDNSSDIPILPNQSVAGEATQSAQGTTQQGDVVTKVVDGDTLVINGTTTIRIIGIDTPETVDPRRPVGCFGKEASTFSKQFLEGKTVRLEKDISETDKYDRLLRYVFVPTPQGEVFFNDLMARQGYARVKTYPPDVKYQQQLLDAERDARANNRGLWGACPA